MDQKMLGVIVIVVIVFTSVTVVCMEDGPLAINLTAPFQNFARFTDVDESLTTLGTSDDECYYCFLDKCQCQGHRAKCTGLREVTCDQREYAATSQGQRGQGHSSQGQRWPGHFSQGQKGQGISSQGQKGQGHSSQGQRWQDHSSQGQMRQENRCYLPEFPKEITALDLSGSFNDSFSPIIITSDFFDNVSRITYLDFSYNYVEKIEGNPFAALKGLTTLLWTNVTITTTGDLSLHLLQPLALLQNVSIINYFFPSYYWMRNRDSTFIRKLQLPRLQRLLLDGYSLNKDNLSCFSDLHNLRELSLNRTGITFATDSPLSVEVLSLRSNYRRLFPDTCFINGTSLFPNLLFLDLSNNIISTLPESVCLPKLQYLNLHDNYFWTSYAANAFAFWTFPNLKAIIFDVHMINLNFGSSATINSSVVEYISMFISDRGTTLFNHKTRLQQSFFKHCPRVSILLIESTVRDYSRTYVEPGTFSELPRLQRLQVKNCLLPKIDKATFNLATSLQVLQLPQNSVSTIFKAAFAALGNLSELDLSDNQISTVDGAFAGLTKLTLLDLSNNKISVISEGEFVRLSSLNVLNLAGNEIAVVSDGTFSQEVRGNLMLVGISHNRLVCNCSMQWFHAWFVERRNVFVGDDILYNCSNHNDTNMRTWLISRQACLFHDPQHFVVLFALSLLLLTGLLTALMCLKRQLKMRARRFLRQHIRMRRMRRAMNVNDGHYEYDVFVSYAEEDGDWVRSVLQPVVEGRWGVRLCLHYRDFHPGKQVLDNIECCMEGSRRTMLVFSPHFARSPWCQFELSLGLDHALNREYDLLVLYLSDVGPEDMTAGMAAILRSCTYLQWAERGLEARLFWNNLRAALPNVGRQSRARRNGRRH